MEPDKCGRSKWGEGDVHLGLGQPGDGHFPGVKSCQQRSPLCSEGIAGARKGLGRRRQEGGLAGETVVMVRPQRQAAWVQLPVLSLNTWVA